MVFLLGFILVTVLAALAFIDARTFRLPDVLTLPLIAAGIIQAYVLSGSVTNAVIGAVAGYGVFLLIEITYRQLRGRDGLGRGDAKLLAAGGAWCGWAGLPPIVLISSALALVALLFPSFKKMADTGEIPFGPFLALAILIVWISLQLA